jgi:hypothetical protein
MTCVRRLLSHPAPTGYPSTPMIKYRVLAAAGDFADELRSLGVHEAASAREALVRCLAQLDQDPVADHEAALRDPELAELLRRDRQQFRDALAEPDVSFIVTPVEAEAHIVGDHDGIGTQVRSSAGGPGCGGSLVDAL